MTMTKIDIDRVCADIREAHATAAMPDDVAAEIETFLRSNPIAVQDLTLQFSAVMLHWTAIVRKHTSERVAEQTAMMTAVEALTVFLRGMKLRRGEELMPGRMALASWLIAMQTLDLEMVPAKLEDADGLLDKLRMPVEVERDELRQRLKSAIHALRSYQHGNAAPDLAEEIADVSEATLTKWAGSLS